MEIIMTDNFNKFRVLGKKIYSVLEVNQYIKGIVSKDPILSNLHVKGELSNFKLHSSGHMYFTLKESNSVIRCVMFKSHGSKIKFKPENGQKVIISGYVSIYERDGQYQLYAEDMQVDGIGNYHLAFTQLKEKLQKEGLFLDENKKTLPLLPKTIGVITSQTGSVIKDIVNVLSRRYNNFNLSLYPVHVQGERSAKEVVSGINCFNRLKNVDVIIIARGGGSIEELWSFNEEIVARAIFKSEIPIISAIGHETDFTIADFVADKRAPTPSAAAELVVPEKIILEKKINDIKVRLCTLLEKNVQHKKEKLRILKNSYALTRPLDRIHQKMLTLDLYKNSLQNFAFRKVENSRRDMEFVIGKLDTLSPLKVLSRGYSVVRVKDEITNTIKKLKVDQEITIELSDGLAECKVNKISEKDVEKYAT
jgi:exodeoxyribonuclease VII large subunit